MSIPLQPRVVSQGAHGRDIVAYKNGLKHAGCRPLSSTDTPTFGHKMRYQVMEFQLRHDLVRTDGVLDGATYNHLVSHIGDYGRHLLATMDAQIRARTQVQRVVQNALWACQTQWQPYFVYDQVRPYPVNHPYRVVDAQHEVLTDCSGFVGMIANWSDAPSPFPSYGYSGSGNTTTMVDELPAAPFPPAPADLVLYDNPGHVVICVQYPLAVSFGAEPGPLKIDSTYRPASHYRRFIPR